MWNASNKCMTSAKLQLDLCHKDLGHLSFYGLSRLINEILVIGISELEVSSDTANDFVKVAFDDSETVFEVLNEKFLTHSMNEELEQVKRLEVWSLCLKPENVNADGNDVVNMSHLIT